MIKRAWIAIGPLTLLIFLLGAGPSLGQEPLADPVINTLDRVASQFLEGVSLGTTQAAYDELLAGSLLLKQTKAIEALVSKTNSLKDLYGEYREFEMIATRRVGKDLVLMKYLYKCEGFPVVWYFTFYRAPPRGESSAENNNWRAIIVRFDTELELLGMWNDSRSG